MFMANIAVLVLALVLAATAGNAQQTRVEITKPSPGDAKGLSPEVPEVYSIPGQFQRILILRFKHQTDLLAGLEKMVKQNNIRNAVILAGIGSLRGYHVHQVSNRDFPSKNLLVKDPTSPADIVSVNGFVVDGAVHAHMTLTDPDKAFGGHIEPGNAVFTFAAITLGVLSDDVELKHLLDKDHR
jgi:predicted DNA-binding protein with PD1-like motif